MPSIRQATATLLLLPTLISALTLDCAKIRADGQAFNLEKLAGPKTVHRVRWEKPSIENTTFTIDICNPLPKDRDIPKDESCPSGTRVCGKEWDYPRAGQKGFVKKVIPIAGEYTATHGRGMEPKFTRLKGSAENSDEKEGVLVELHGGKYPNEKNGVKQKAVIEFLCDKSKTGNEGFEDEKMGEEVMSYGRMGRRADDDDEDEPKLPNLDEGKSLKFVSYKEEKEVEVLRLQWKTKYACEGVANDKDPEDAKKGSWGFFTWFIIILFMLTAAYIIFGSWLNYNRYGARGWDLIPHGDSIRDVPYIVKDWIVSVTERIKGGDMRGGYSAV